MKKLFLLGLCFGVLYALIIGCSSDIILESESELKGNFVGTYAVTSDFGSSNSTEKLQTITWIFTDSTYVMQIDTSEVFNADWCICRVDGRYNLSEGILLNQLHSIPDEKAGCNACEESTNPKGEFSLIRQGNSDTLRLTQYIDGLFKEIQLYRIPSE